MDGPGTAGTSALLSVETVSSARARGKPAFKVAHDLAHSTEDGAAVALPSVAMQETATPATGQTQRTVGLVIGGVGVVGVVVGAIAGIVAKSKVDDLPCNGNVCPPSAVAELESAQSLARASTVSLVFAVDNTLPAPSGALLCAHLPCTGPRPRRL